MLGGAVSDQKIEVGLLRSELPVYVGLPVELYYLENPVAVWR